MKKIYLQILVVFLTLLGANVASAQTNSVTLTPPTGPAVNYASITAAYNAIPTPLTGNYLIELQTAYAGTDASEVYPITLTDKLLAPGGFTITIRPAAGNNGETIQRVTPAAGAVMLLNGADNIIIDGRPGGVTTTATNYLTFNDPFVGSAASRNIELIDGSNNNIIRWTNQVAAAATAAGLGSRIINISTSNTANNNNTITNNIVTGGLRGIQVFGTVANNTGTVISNNTVRDFGAIGIFGGSFQDNTTIQLNTVTFTTPPATTGATGIQNQAAQGTVTVTNIVDNTVSIPLSASATVASANGIVVVCNGTANILRNVISNVSSGGATTSNFCQGISAGAGTAPATINISRNKIFDLSSSGPGNIRGMSLFPFAGSTLNVDNNFVAITQANATAGAIFGILFGLTGAGSNYTTNNYFNTVRIGGSEPVSSTSSAYGIYRSDNNATSVYNQKNNISIMERTGGAATVFFIAYNNPSAVGILNVDYNTYYATDPIVGFAAGYNGTAYTNAGLATYKTATTPNEQNSNFTNVSFVSSTDLHLAGASLTDVNLNGVPGTGVLTDIDGLTRSVTTPTRGGDEASVALPITFSNFNAKRNGLVNTLTWSTSQELNTRSFVVERSTDGRSFVELGRVAAAGNSNTERNYQFNDASPVKGMNYYRIKTVDLDNSEKFSTVKNVRYDVNSMISVYPNPVVDVAKLYINADAKENAVVIVADMSGAQVYSRNFALAEGSNTLSLDISNLSKGFYVVQVKLSTQTYTQKISKL